MIAFYTAVWAICYAEATHDDLYLPMPTQSDFPATMSTQDVLAKLCDNKEHVSFDYGISEHDLTHNGVVTSVIEVLLDIEDRLRRIEKFVKNSGHATELRAYLRYVKPMHPDFRLAGADGALTDLRELTGITSVKGLAKEWLRNVTTKLDFLRGSEATVIFPTPSQNILHTGLVNEKLYFSGMSVALNLKYFISALLRHKADGLLHVPNADHLHLAQENLHRSYKDITTTFEIRMASQTCGFDRLADWVLLQDSIKKLLDVLYTSYYYDGGDVYDHNGGVRSQRAKGNSKDVRQVRIFQRPTTDDNVHV